jgi:hypothetical protein
MLQVQGAFAAFSGSQEEDLFFIHLVNLSTTVIFLEA